MSTTHFPQESTLRRHTESAAYHSQLAWLEKPPTDSTLRRHHAQLKGNTATATKASELRQTPPQSSPIQAAQATPPETKKRSGLLGFFGRLLGI